MVDLFRSCMCLSLYQQPHRYKASMSGHVTPWPSLPRLPVLAQVDISALAPHQVFAFLSRHA